MAASDHLGLQFEHHELGNEHAIRAIHPEHGVVGSMYWYKTAGQKWGHTTHAGEISEIRVHPDFQRQGIGTEMYHRAHDYDPKPLHASDKTPAGASWARKVGGPGV